MKKLLYNIILLIFLISCKEVYKPSLNTQPKILVVDALITNELKEHKIHLSRAVRFDSLANYNESGAFIYIRDNNGNIYGFNERIKGDYYSDSSQFKPIIGHKYQLFIKTKDGLEFSSDLQELLPPGTINEVINKAQELPYYLNVDNKQKIQNVQGTEVIISHNISSDNDNYFRFKGTQIVEFTSITETVVSYCWKRYDASIFPILNEGHNLNPGTYQLKLGFVPIDRFFYSIYDMKKIDGRPPREIITYNNVYNYYVTVKQYHMNKSVYDAFALISTQLKANDKIFDPLNIQIKGNLKCLNDSSQLVLGLFDVSSVNIETYRIEDKIIDNSYRFIKIKPVDFDTIPIMGANVDDPPKSWIY